MVLADNLKFIHYFFQFKHATIPAICSGQLSPVSSGCHEGNLAARMWLVKFMCTVVEDVEVRSDAVPRADFHLLDTLLNIELRWSELPDGPVKLLSNKTGRCHSMQEVSPRHFAWRRCYPRIIEQGAEDFEGTGVNWKCWLWVHGVLLSLVVQLFVLLRDGRPSGFDLVFRRLPRHGRATGLGTEV